MLHREPLPGGRTRLTFTLPAQDPPGEVSVVGSFNDWRAGLHPLQLSPEGTRQVSVTVEPGSHYFRYLATGNRWDDEPDADVITEHGSVVHCPSSEPAKPAPPPTTRAARRKEPASAAKVTAQSDGKVTAQADGKVTAGPAGRRTAKKARQAAH